MSNDALDKLIWALIYSGLVVGGIGLFVLPGSAAFGWLLIGAGLLDTAAGVVLVWVRSRRRG